MKLIFEIRWFVKAEIPDFQDDEDEDPDGDDDDGSGEWNIRESQIFWLDQSVENTLKMRFNYIKIF